MVLLTISLAVLLAQLFPLATIIYGAFGTDPGSSLRLGEQAAVSALITYVPAALAAWWSLRRLGAHKVARQLTQGRRWMKAGLVLYFVYLVLALGGILLSGIPYGGGTVPRILSLLPVLVQGLLFVGLVRALVLELPRASPGKTGES